MEYPRMLRAQLKEYEANGFHAVLVEPRAGSHFKVVFAEFPEPQFLTKNIKCPRSLRNNIARFKKLAEGKK